MADVSMCRLLTGVVGGTLLLLSAQTVGLEILTDVSWDTAVRTCSSHGRKLYTTDTSVLDDLTSGSYWMGAKVQYSSWIWTATGKPLFVYVGELNTSRVTTLHFGRAIHSYTILYDNQASRCYYKCRHSNNNNVKPRYIGLQDSMCYCFTYFDLDLISTDSHTPGRCFGNFMENCGTNNTVSIYKPEVISGYRYITWSLNPHGICAYIIQGLYYITVKDEENCMTQKGYICNCSNYELNNTCYHHTENKSWFSAKTSCALTTLKENNIKYIRKKMQSGTSYWIGLKRTKYIAWVDRGDPVTTYITYNSSGCLVLTKEPNGNISFHVSNCSEQKSALCLNTFSSTTGVNKEDTTPPIKTFTTKHQQAISSSSTASTLPGKESGQSGVAVGVSVTIVILVIIGTLVAVFWMKRSKRFCFKTKPVSMEIQRPGGGREESDYDQVKETSNYEFETVTHKYLHIDTSARDPVTQHDVTPGEDDYNVLSGSSPPHSPVKANADAYSRVNLKKKAHPRERLDVKDDDDYDTAGSNVRSPRDPTYNHITGNHTGEVTDGDYDTAGSNVRSPHDSTYNHITGNRTGEVTDGDYDTAGSNMMSPHDSTYNHITGNHANDVSEGDYDTARENVMLTHDPDYDHIRSEVEGDYSLASM